MVEVFGLIEKLRAVNEVWQPAHALYLYKDTAYYIVYGIIETYKNHFRRPQTLAPSRKV